MTVYEILIKNKLPLKMKTCLFLTVLFGWEQCNFVLEILEKHGRVYFFWVK